MAYLTEPVTLANRPALHRYWASVAAAMLILTCGCVGIDGNSLCESGPPAAGSPCQVAATWQPQIYITHDPARNGADTPTLVGRVYLFGPEIKYSMPGDGALVVDLYEGAVATGAPAVPLEEYRYDPAALRKLLRRDAIGWGYTVPFMWSTYRPDVTRVQMKVRYEPVKGTPLYAENASMAIENPGLPLTGPVVSQSAKPALAAK
jgi:hypothetical protein